MAKEESKNRWAGIIVGPIMTLIALSALWKNETRFNFYKAATRTTPIATLDEATEDQLISFTGPMDQRLTIEGEYVESFTGFMMVQRDAEIYAWDRDKSDDSVRWELRWMSNVESNERNEGLRQDLYSGQILPPNYDVGELPIDSELMEFVDPYQGINPNSLTIVRPNLQIDDAYLYLRKYRPDGLGDERVSYRGIPVPATATYFGKFSSRRGVADRSNQRTGFVNSLIQDTGILHHLVSGERETALASIKSYFTRMKWIVRAIGTSLVVAGFYILFATIFGWLFHIPILGRLAESGTILVALAIGIPLAMTTMLAGYLFAHPLIFTSLLAVIVASVVYLRRRGARSRQVVQQSLSQKFGHDLSPTEFKDEEFLELAHLALHDSEFGIKEKEFLQQWAKRHRWDESKTARMLELAQQRRADAVVPISNDQHLQNLIQLALADGNLTRFEMQSIRTTANRLGYDASDLRERMQQIRSQTLNQP